MGCFSLFGLHAQEVTRLNYGEKLLAKLSLPGIGLMLLGAVMVYASGPISGRLFPGKAEKASLCLKGAGCVLAVAGALILLDFI